MRPTYGPVWREFRNWYFNHPYTVKRCVWCLTPGRPRNPIQLNHLTYAMPDPDRPAWWQVAPMCLRCHELETWLTRALFGEYPHRRARRAHYYVTLGVLGLAVLAALLAVTLALRLAVG